MPRRAFTYLKHAASRHHTFPQFIQTASPRGGWGLLGPVVHL